MIGLVCIDVDGTLVGRSGVVAPRVWDAAAAARAVGIRLAMCTGRPGFGIARAWATRLDATGWHIFQNGASVIDLGGGGSRSCPLPRAILDVLVARARASGRVLELYDDHGYAVERDTPRSRAHAELLEVPFGLRAFAELAAPVRAQWLVDHDELPAVLAEPVEGVEAVPSTSPIMPDTTFVNMTATGIGKHTGVRVIAEAYGIDLADVMVIGDAPNDLGALAVCGHPVAMADADPQVLAVARTIVADADDAGVAQALALAIASAPQR